MAYTDFTLREFARRHGLRIEYMEEVDGEWFELTDVVEMLNRAIELETSPFRQQLAQANLKIESLELGIAHSNQYIAEIQQDSRRYELLKSGNHHLKVTISKPYKLTKIRSTVPMEQLDQELDSRLALDDALEAEGSE